MLDLVNMVFKFLVLLVLLRSCFGVIYNLNDTDYARMPPLFALDSYDKCYMVDPRAVYCIADFDLFTEEKSALMEMIQVPSVTLTVNTNLTTPLKLKSIEPFRLQSVPNNYTYILSKNITLPLTHSGKNKKKLNGISFHCEYSALTVFHYNHTQIHRGICVSQTCKDVLEEHTLNATLDLNATLEACLNKTIWNDYRLQTRLNKIVYCYKGNKTSELDSSDMMIIIFYFVIITLNTIGSLYDFLFCKGGKGNRYLLAFSLRRNWSKLIASPDEGPEPRLRRLKLFHGMKTLTMICVIFSHAALVISYTYVENPLYIEKSGEDLSKQILFNGSLVTHTFFVISGFLVAFNFELHAEKHTVSWWQLPKSIFLRWLRLIPVFGLTLGTVATLMRNAGKGPLWDLIVITESQACREYWWTNLLFINNYFYDNSCMVQTWYLACDFQLFILGMVICILARTPRAQTIAIAIMSTVAVIIVGAQTYFQNLDPVVIQTPEKYRDLYKSDDTFRLLYSRGHTNIATYTMGLAAGFLTYYILTQGKDVSKYKRYRWVVWLTVPTGVAVILSGGIFYTDKVYPKVVTILYAMFYKQVFQLVIIIFVLGTIFKIENVERRIIEWRGFTWMGRASYNAFLVHTLMQRSLIGIQRTPLYVTDYFVTITLAATVLLSFILGAILWLGVESPVNALTKALLQPVRPSKDTKEPQELPYVNSPQHQNNV